MLNICKNEGAVLDPAVVFRQDGAMRRASVVHHVPGRMRLRSPALKGDVLAIADLRVRLRRNRGYHRGKGQRLYGKRVAGYDPAIVSPDELVEALVIRGLTRPAALEADGTDSRWADHLATAVKGWATNALAEQLAFSLIRLLV
jgi:hypothetical protein